MTRHEHIYRPSDLILDIVCSVYDMSDDNICDLIWHDDHTATLVSIETGDKIRRSADGWDVYIASEDKWIHFHTQEI